MTPSVNTNSGQIVGVMWSLDSSNEVCKTME